MMYWAIIAPLLLTSSVRGQATHIVAVGRDGLVFSPAVIVAAIGDLVQYQFYPGNFSNSIQDSCV